MRLSITARLLRLRYPVLMSLCIAAAACRGTAGSKDGGKAGAAAFPETFEQGAKHAYAPADAALATGSWHLDGALIGKSAADAKDGNAALRLAPGGHADMGFDLGGGVQSVRLRQAVFSHGTGGAWSLWYSADGGATWAQAGDTQHPGAALSEVTVAIPPVQRIRFSIHNDGGTRINIDDFEPQATAGGAPVAAPGSDGTAAGSARTISSASSARTVSASRDDNMALGNPSKARADEKLRDNYLLVRPQYALSYNDSKGMANWVSWHLSTAWRGDAKRCNCFMSDAALPASFFKALTSHYIATGFDRGHLCPSDDRDGSAEDNAATFLMSNMSPQAPLLNQQPWEHLESYCRKLADEGKELYIVAGGYGQRGTGAKGVPTATIAGGAINVPAHFWKIIVVLPTGSDDLQRITAKTRVIAIDMPNTQDVAGKDWKIYRTSVDAIETATGYDFLDKIPKALQDAIEARVDAVKD